MEFLKSSGMGVTCNIHDCFWSAGGGGGVGGGNPSYSESTYKTGSKSLYYK